MRGNRSELAPAPKSPRCHVKTTSVQAGTSFNRKMKKGKSTFSFVAELYYHQFLGRFLFNFRRRWQLAFSENKECVRTAQPAINHANIYFWKTLREMIKTIHVCKNVRGSGKWLLTLYWTSRSYLKILSSNLCSVSYELDQESEQLDLSSYFLLIRSSGSQTQGTFFVLQCISRTD